MMSGETYEFEEASAIAVGALGRPGHRVFLLQVTDSARRITLKLEKGQVAALASSIDTLLEDLVQQEVATASGQGEPSPLQVDDELPLEPHFVAGQIGLGFDRETQRVVLVVQEIEYDQEDESPGVARVWATCTQMRALSLQAREAVAGGRPICPLCQGPIDPQGHFCPKRNGHGHQVDED